MTRAAPLVLCGALLTGLAACDSAAPTNEVQGSDAAASRVHVAPESDARAIAIAQSVVERLGGWDGWDATRFVRWDFFGRRLHYWDKTGARARIEAPERLVLIDLADKSGRVWEQGVEITDPERLEPALVEAHQIWINDSYWMFMPFKLLDPGVTLRHAGQRDLPDGRPADVLDVTFGEGVGYTPSNRYEVFVGQESGRVEQWSFYADRSETEPRFTLPWSGWKRFGEILLATDHGRGDDWRIAVYDELPDAVFEDPAPVALDP